MSNTNKLGDLKVSGGDSEIFKAKMAQKTNELIVSIEGNIEQVIEELGIESEEEVFDHLGRYIVSKTVVMIKDIINEFINESEEENRLKLKITYSGSDYLKMVYARATMDNTTGKYNKDLLEGFKSIKSFPEEVVVELDGCVVAQDFMPLKAKLVKHSAEIKNSMLEAFSPVFEKIKLDIVKDIVENASEKTMLANAIIDGLKRSVLEHDSVLADTPARFNASYVANATNIKIKDNGKYKAISANQLTELLEKQVAETSKEISIDDVVSGISFK